MVIVRHPNRLRRECSTDLSQDVMRKPQCHHWHLENYQCCATPQCPNGQVVPKTTPDDTATSFKTVLILNIQAQRGEELSVPTKDAKVFVEQAGLYAFTFTLCANGVSGTFTGKPQIGIIEIAEFPVQQHHVSAGNMLLAILGLLGMIRTRQSAESRDVVCCWAFGAISALSAGKTVAHVLLQIVPRHAVRSLLRILIFIVTLLDASAVSLFVVVLLTHCIDGNHGSTTPRWIHGFGAACWLICMLGLVPNHSSLQMRIIIVILVSFCGAAALTCVVWHSRPSIRYARYGSLLVGVSVVVLVCFNFQLMAVHLITIAGLYRGADTIFPLYLFFKYTLAVALAFGLLQLSGHPKNRRMGWVLLGPIVFTCIPWLNLHFLAVQWRWTVLETTVMWRLDMLCFLGYVGVLRTRRKVGDASDKKDNHTRRDTEVKTD